MSKEARDNQVPVSQAILEKIQELSELISLERFGTAGVPREITFSEIEQIGHESGRLLATHLDSELMTGHAEHFSGEAACPKCGRSCPSRPNARELTTRDGVVELPEAACDCKDCRRSFFPSAGRAEA